MAHQTCGQQFATAGFFYICSFIARAPVVGTPAVSTPAAGTRAWGGRLTKRLFAALLRYTLEQATLPRLFAPFYPFQHFHI